MSAAVQLNEEQFLDPMWRIHNLYTIVDKNMRAIPFRPNWAQAEFLENMHSMNLILKARQLGFTTLIALVQLDDCLFSPNVRAAMIAHRLDDAKVIFRDKVKFAYDKLDEGLKNAVRAIQDSADTLTMNNGSSIRVSTSTRSGTLKWLHVSEYGKICAQFPDKAREIRTGALPSAEKGIVTIESTAEGDSGDFYDKCVEAMSAENTRRKLGRLEYKFFFFPWFRESAYKLQNTSVRIPPEDAKYFDKIEKEIAERAGIKKFSFTAGQKAWWMAQEKALGADVKREYPATPQEAFEQAVEGAYFADQLASAEKHGRIGDFPVDPNYPVNTYWDLGRNDLNVIWLHQTIGEWERFVGYYENQDEFIGHYINWLQDWRLDNGVTFGTHFLPHDGDVKSLWLENGTLSVMKKLRFRPKIVPRVNNKIEAIRQARAVFPYCQFDEANCKVGLGRLRRYRRNFNERLNVYSDTPLHNEDSHGADGFLTFSNSYKRVKAQKPGRDRYRISAPSRGSYMSA